MELKVDQVVIDYGFVQNCKEACSKKINGSSIIHLVLYVDNIIMMGNDITPMSTVKLRCLISSPWKILASYVLGIKLLRKRGKKLLGLHQGSYIDKLLE